MSKCHNKILSLSSMKNLICLLFASTFFLSCEQENQQVREFSTFLNVIPEIQLPFKINSYTNLTYETNNDTLFKKIITDEAGISGKIKINDTINAIVWILHGGQADYPSLITYDKFGNKIAEQGLIDYNSDDLSMDGLNSSFMSLNEKFEISITDTITTSKLDDESNFIENTRKMEVKIYRYKITNSGKIIDIK